VSTAASNAGVSGCHVNLKPIELRFRRVEVRHERRTSVSRNRTEETRDRTRRVKKAAYNCEHGSKSNRALIFNVQGHMAVCQNLVPLVNIKIAGKWMFIPLKMVLIGIDPYPYRPKLEI